MMQKKVFSQRVFTEVQSVLNLCGVESKLGSQINIGMYLDLEPPTKKINVTFSDWRPSLPKSALTEAQILANFSFEQRNRKEKDFLKTIDNAIFSAVDNGKTLVEVEVPEPVIVNSESCARILGSVLNQSFSVRMFGSKFKIELPPPCIEKEDE